MTKTPFEHIMIIILENRSFDHMFGTYPYGVQQPIVNSITQSVGKPVGLPSLNGLFYDNTYETPDPYEGGYRYHADWNYGAMNGWTTNNGSGPNSLGYLSYQQVPYFWDLAILYTLHDNFYPPVLSTTGPNRTSWMMGYPAQSTGGEFIQSILYFWLQNNVSWKIYAYQYSPGGNAPFPLSDISGASAYAQYYAPINQFLTDVANGNIPDVTYLTWTNDNGSDFHSNYDCHPPFDLLTCQQNLATYMNAIEQSPIWGSTLVIITFDEFGGFYDHVVPPIFYTYGQAQSDQYLVNAGANGYFVLGGRIPMLAISPYSQQSFVNHNLVTPFTILNFINYNFGVNNSFNSIVSNTDINAFSESFDFSYNPRPPVLFNPSSLTYPVQPQSGYVGNFSDIPAQIRNIYTPYLLLYTNSTIDYNTLKYISQFWA